MAEERIQKILSRLGYGSRRSIEQLIQNNNIIINKKKIILGEKIDIKNIHELYINKIKINFNKKKQKIEKRILIYNKPVGEISTRKDPLNRITIFKNLPKLTNTKWISVGRLDLNTSGLIIFTNCGQTANKLMHPKNYIKRVYLARLFGKINVFKINMLRMGLTIENNFLHFNEIKIHNSNKTFKWYKVSLYEGKNREIRKLFNYLQIQVSRLIRIQYGSISLPHSLYPGNFKELSNKIRI
ncbi:Ribosomal large subunit pseudouridine synthase B [Buchnera aphidicola (Thelaxes suberi)]|uniref:pseudouridine synthase n=1 Tax=Buchnera aphidicola TaxID=9 RepID=UPI003464083F